MILFNKINPCKSSYELNKIDPYNMTKPRVDAVITWVNSNDREWIDKFNSYKNDDLTNENIYRFNNSFCPECELRLCISLILKNLPWIHNIIIVTMRPQRPTLLDEDRFSNESRIKVIHHDEFFRDISDLPTFNSHSIEANLSNIPGLSEHFIYFNDDMYVIRPIDKKEMFPPSGYVSAFVYKYNKNNKYKVYKNFKGMYHYGWYNLHELELSKGIQTFYSLSHGIIPLTKTGMDKSRMYFKREWDLTSSSRFRSKTDIPPIGCTVSYMCRNNLSVIQTNRFIKYIMSRFNILYLINNYKIICVNELDNSNIIPQIDLLTRTFL